MRGQRPKVVVFDLGKVLVDFNYSIAVRRFADRSEAGLERVQELVNSPIQFDYESGLITTDEFFAAVRDGAGFRGNRAEFVEIFADIFSPMERMIPFFDRVKVAGIPTCVFSNTNEIAIGHIRDRFSFYSRFDGYVLSFEEKGMKPGEPIYRVVEQRTGESETRSSTSMTGRKTSRPVSGLAGRRFCSRTRRSPWRQLKSYLAFNASRACAAAPYAPARSPSCAGSNFNS